MQATLYLPQQHPQAINIDGLSMPDLVTGFVGVPHGVPVAMGCVPELIDVLASGSNYVVYSISDCEGLVNQAAMEAVTEVSGVSFDMNDEDMVLRGALLVVKAN